ncbi:hypothetical protein BCR33DRAFT_715617 [Rhizoclosmatium globosum]|uniref:G-protein coupled receptors family 1 profile domain-containing protein n=1 Tax=Rhizoclosmatium globosum TaxID=329046 RepID=A0A1Y2CJR0_9FUNG|nr:hypothetical protein BCR33DRAFT_715617 [Rhizoclosmatium globosum]|eukprot:ORY46575.1 hypothetical protein BCR33DRAFT_715617 [Rhizoclosmatium globosum]
MTDTALGHLFYIFFDAFMLYKTYQISHKNFYILFINVILMANRIIWSVLDTTHSSAAYDTTEQLCVFNQNEWTGIGYNAADTIIDSYATIVAVAASWHKFNSWRNTYRAMVEKNILRSVIVISMDAFLVWANANWTTQYLSWLCWFLQNYTLARALNWDLFWFPESVTLCTCVKKGSPESQLSVSEGSFGQGDRNTAAGSDIKNSVTSQEGQHNSGFGTNTILPLRTVQVVQPLQRSPSKRGMS